MALMCVVVVGSVVVISCSVFSFLISIFKSPMDELGLSHPRIKEIVLGLFSHDENVRVNFGTGLKP